MDNTLVIIPARKGSKGILGKNTKLLNGKPLISYTIEAAVSFFKPENICVSTNDKAIIEIAKKHGLKVPFKRPEHLSEDTTAMIDVLFHAIDFYKNQGRHLETLVLLQPTSPFRNAKHISEAIKLYNNNEVDMVVSVKESKANPYYNLFEEDKNKWLQQSKTGNFTRRQDVPKVYELNGAIYVINIESLIKTNSISLLNRKMKYAMDEIGSFDLDNETDWLLAEAIANKKP